MRPIRNIGEQHTEMTPLEASIGVTFVRPEEEPHRIHIGKPVNIISGGNSRVGFYRRKLESGDFALLPALVYDSLAGEDPKYREETERPTTVPSQGAIVEAVTIGQYRRLLDLGQKNKVDDSAPEYSI